MYCLEDIRDSNEWNHDSRTDAQSFFLALSRFPFIFALVVTKEVLAYTKGLSVKLQGRYVDIVKAYREIEFVQSTVQSARDDIDNFHARVYSTALQVARSVQVDEHVPRTTGRQQHRNNVPFTSISEYFRLSLTTPLLDYLITEMNDRFSEQLSSSLLEIERLLPSDLCMRTAALTKEDISGLLRVYEDHVPALGSIDVELHCWSLKWQQNINEAKLLNSPAKALSIVDDDFFPNVRELLTVSCTLPVTSAECERSVS